jgi:excisionase family DNA binding protein
MDAPLTLDELRSRLTISLWPEAAGVLGIGRSTAYELARTGEIPTRRLGAQYRVPTHELLAMFGAPTGDADPPPALADVVPITAREAG